MIPLTRWLPKNTYVTTPMGRINSVDWLQAERKRINQNPTRQVIIEQNEFERRLVDLNAKLMPDGLLTFGGEN